MVDAETDDSAVAAGVGFVDGVIRGAVCEGAWILEGVLLGVLDRVLHGVWDWIRKNLGMIR